MKKEQIITDNSRSCLYSHLKSGARFAIIAIGNNDFEKIKIDIKNLKSWYAFIDAKYIYEMDGKIGEKWELLLFISGVQKPEVLKLARKYNKPSIIFSECGELKIIYSTDSNVSGEHQSGAVAQTLKADNHGDTIKNSFSKFRVGDSIIIGDGTATITDCQEVVEYIIPTPTETRSCQKNKTEVISSKLKIL